MIKNIFLSINQSTINKSISIFRFITGRIFVEFKPYHDISGDLVKSILLSLLNLLFILFLRL